MALKENGPQTQAQLVKIERIDHSTVAKSLGRMEMAGLIKRRPSGEDRRATIVSLTAKGTALHKKIETVWRDLERVSAADLTAEQREHFLQTMQIVEESIAKLAKNK